MGDRDKVVNIGARTSRDDGVAHQHELLVRCRQIAEKDLCESIKQVFDKADDLLFERSNHQNGSEDGASRYFDALRELRIKRQEMTQAYLEALLREHDGRLRRAPAAAGKPGGRVPLGGGLSLIDEKELEESLAVEGMVGKAGERCNQVLYALSQRYAQLAEGVKLEPETHPLAPEVICHAFRDALGGIEVGVEIKLIIYKLFEKHAVKPLDELYDKLNTLLADAGILPQLKATAPVRSSSAAAERPRPAAAADVATEAAANNSLPVPVTALTGMAGGGGDGDVYHTLQRLMNLKKYGGAAPGAEGGGSPGGAMAGVTGQFGGSGYGGGAVAAVPVAATVLIEGLSLLQQLPPPPPEMTAGHAAIAYIKSSLLERIGDSALGKTIDPVTDNTIDVIGMIFEFILDETSIPESVKRLLNQLQIPILKVAIVDKEFFANKQHPARRLLNSLGHASIGWNDKDPHTQRRRFEKMEYLVGRVLKEYETDPSVFAELLADFTGFLATEVDDEEPAEEWAQEESPPGAPEEEQIAPGKHAFETVELRLGGVEAPRLVRDFLRDTWRRVLEQVAAAEGPESDSWRRRVQLMDDLLWSVEPKPGGDERRRMVALLPRLLGGLQDGMSAVGCQPAEMDAVLNGLQPIHMACLRGEAPPSEAGEPPPRAPRAPASQEVTDMIRSIQQGMDGAESAHDQNTANGVADLERQLAGAAHGGDFISTFAGTEEDSLLEPGETLIEDEFTEKGRALAIGTWLEFAQGDKPRRGKLGWKSAVLGQYVFVDRRYKVVTERTLAELAADLRTGRAHVVEKVGMFDRALDAVMAGLMAGAGAR